MEYKPSVLTDRYKVGKKLGQGNFGKVYYGRSVDTNQTVAIKVIDKEQVKKAGIIDQTKREISIMSIVKHPNVVGLYEVMATKSKIFLVLEYCKGGDLFKKVFKGGKLREDVAWKYFYQLINAVDFCHSRGVYHRDLKLENLLLDESDNLKVADFGLSAINETKRQDGLLHTGCGTNHYLSPEIIDHKGYDGAKADIWACGVILFMLLTGCYPFYGPNETALYEKIRIAKFKSPNWFSPELKRLFSRMLNPNQENRDTISRIKQSSWFRKCLYIHKEMEKRAKDANSMEVGGSGENHEPLLLANLNAFDIIAWYSWFNLGGLFGEVHNKQQSRFTSQKPASEIISKLEEVSKSLNVKIRKQNAGLFKLERTKEGIQGTVAMDAEIFQLTPMFHVVEVKKCNGDIMEYQKLVEEDLRSALADIIWFWQDESEKEKDDRARNSLAASSGR